MSDKAECLEDGEIADSSDSDKDSGIKPINTNPLENTLEQRFQPRLTTPSSDRAYRSTNNPCTDSSGDSSSDNEDEFNSSPIKTKRGRPHFPLEGSNGNSHNPGFMQAANLFQKKGKDLWNEVVLEQTIDDSVRKVSTSTKDDKHVDRGVESYDYKSVETLPEYVKNTRETVDYGDDMFGGGSGEEEEEEEMADDKDTESNDICDIENFGSDKTKLSARFRLGLKEHEGEAEDSAPSLCDIETFGTGPSRKRTIRDRLGKKTDSVGDKEQKSPITDCGQDSMRMEDSERTDDHGKGDRKNAKDRLGQRQHRSGPMCYKATFNFNCKETDPPEDVAMSLLSALGEPHWQAEMFHRIVTTIGVKKSIEIFFMTENIEETGGMLIMNGERRRSAGGVYIQLVKTDTDTTKEMITKMFPFQNVKRAKRNKRSKNKREDKMETEADSSVKHLPTKADILLAGSNNSVTLETKTDSMDELDLCENEVHIELDFPDD